MGTLPPTQGELFGADAHGEPGFRGPQVCALVGITYRQLDYWARTDLLRPSIEDAKGSGSQRVYSYRDLVSLKVIKKLLDAGMSLQSVRRAITYLHEHMGEDVASANLVIDGANAVLADNGQLIDLISGGQGVLNIVAMGAVVNELDATISDLSEVKAAKAEGAASAATPRRATGS